MSSDEVKVFAPDPAPPRKGRRLFQLSVRTLLVAIVLVPIAVSIGLAATIVLHQSSIRHQAVTANQSTRVLDSLLRSRAAIDAEYLSSVEVVVAQVNHLSGTELDSLLGIDVQANLTADRRANDHQAVFAPKGPLAGLYGQLVRLRASIDAGGAPVDRVETFFNELGTMIDQRWQGTFGQLSNDSDSSATRGRLAALDLSFTASTAGLAEDPLVESLLTTTATSAQVEGLVVDRQEFDAAVLGFPNGLGPKAAATWTALAHDPLTKLFSSAAVLAISVGIGHETPPYATDVTALAGIAKSEAALVTSLTDLVLASSADLRATTASQISSATRTLEITFVSMLLLVVLAVGAVLSLGAAIRRPLTRIAAAAQSVRAGEFELPLLDESGPKELALASTAFNEMSSTLGAVQTQAMALARGDLEATALQRPLPGRTGEALQSALNELQTSVRLREAQREVLHEQATRDSLTGLLNRGAALEALQLDLARVRRDGDALTLAVLFIDLDNLKKINDTFGHEGGDAALETVAESLRATTRASDVVARFGGDEFIVGCLGETGSESPRLLAARICARVASTEIHIHGRRSKLGCSIGGAVFLPSDHTIEALIKRADDALYLAKANGRGQVRWSEPE
jgi:diguanylate cyclase (GGDEF)-like protein